MDRRNFLLGSSALAVAAVAGTAAAGAAAPMPSVPASRGVVWLNFTSNLASVDGRQLPTSDLLALSGNARMTGMGLYVGPGGSARLRLSNEEHSKLTT